MQIVANNSGWCTSGMHLFKHVRRKCYYSFYLEEYISIRDLHSKLHIASYIFRQPEGEKESKVEQIKR